MGDLDRRKHDVDIIERVLGGIRDSRDGDEFDEHIRTRVVDIDLPRGSAHHSTLEVTVGLGDDSDRRSRSRGRS